MLRIFSDLGSSVVRVWPGAVAKGLIGLCLALMLAVAPAAAQGKLDSYRADGVIAERFDGYVEIRGSGAPSDAVRLVRRVNEQRKQLYTKRARESEVPVSEVGKVFATRIVKQAPKGTFFRRPNGSYTRK